MNSRLVMSIDDAPASNICVRQGCVPHSAGDFTPAGGGMCLPIVLKSWPMKPSGVQFAMPILPPALADPQHLGGGLVVIGGEHHAEGRDHRVEARIRERQRLGIGFLELDDPAFRLGAVAALIEQRRHVIGRRHVAPAPRGSERDVAVAGGDIEHFLARAQIHRLAEIFADDLQGRADDGVVAGRPGALLAGLQGGEIGSGGGGRRGGQGRSIHGRSFMW